MTLAYASQYLLSGPPSLASSRCSTPGVPPSHSATPLSSCPSSPLSDHEDEDHIVGLADNEDEPIVITARCIKTSFSLTANQSPPYPEHDKKKRAKQDKEQWAKAEGAIHLESLNDLELKV